MATVRSAAEHWGNTENPHLAPKPAGLAVGDRIVVYIASDGDGFPTSAPAGFVQVTQTANLTKYNGTMYTKIADAGDVAAANFPFGNAGGKHMQSMTWAVIGGGVVGAVSGGSGTVNSQTHVANFAQAFTPPSANALVLWGAVAGSVIGQAHINGASLNGTVQDVNVSPWWIYAGYHAPYLTGLITSAGCRLNASQKAGFCCAVIADPQPADSPGRYNRALNPRVKANLVDGFSTAISPASQGFVHSADLPPGFSAWPAASIDACARSVSSVSRTVYVLSPVVPGRVYRASCFVGAGTYYTDPAMVPTTLGSGWTFYQNDGVTVVPVNPYISPTAYKDLRANGQWGRVWSAIVAAPPQAAWLEWAAARTGSLGSTAEGRRIYLTGFMLEEGSGPFDVAIANYDPAQASCYGDGATPGWAWVD